jgi:hypothetical protein
MAWISVDLDNTLVGDDGMGGMVPLEGAVEAMTHFAMEGHRLTVFTSRFAPMPDDRRNKLKMEIEQHLMECGFPPMEVWTGTTKPDADIYISNNAVTFDQDWGLVLAQTETMLQERGLAAGPQPGSMEAGMEQEPPQQFEEEQTDAGE